MLPYNKGYALVAGDDESDSSSAILEKGDTEKTERPNWTRRFILGGIAVVIATHALILAIYLEYITFGGLSSAYAKCDDLRIRREWRGLEVEERTNYIEAVQCLQDLPSQLTGNGSFYDDLVYVHMFVGSLSHAAASFLPWHRAFLHVYENVLTEHCGLKIPLPYWDWELDHQSLETSSIFSSETGFGGDGSPDLPNGVGQGRCVVDGPFANTTRLYWEGKEQPHCLGRGFQFYETNELGRISGTWFTPENMGELKRMQTYAQFEDRVEGMVHNNLHWSIRGDFSSMTAANDPIFWLHHTKIDKLWWEWQGEDPRVRNTAYEGVSFNTTAGREKEGTMDDVLEFMGMWRDSKVSEVMETEGRTLCYRY